MKETRYLDPSLERVEIRMSRNDRDKIDLIKDIYVKRSDIKPSLPLIISIALSSLYEELRMGRTRGHSSFPN